MSQLPAWNASSYDQVSTVQQDWGRRVLAGLGLGGGETVLDAGCGTARLAELLAEAVPGGEVIAVDNSMEMLAVARERVAARVELLRADLLALPLAGALDVIFSNAVFHWIVDHLTLFRSLFAALKSGGRLVAQCGGATNLARAYGLADQVAAKPPFSAYPRSWPFRFATAEETAQLLEQAGFTGVETSLTQAPTPFPSREKYRDFVGTVILRPYLGALPAPLQPDFIEAFVDASPEWHLDYVRLNLYGRKP
jgi:trans-aconitate 2-methyltransferase